MKLKTDFFQTNSFRLFATVFAYTALTSIGIQFIILPSLLPSLHAGNGLIKGIDSVYFHDLAVIVAKRVQENGWHEWIFRPARSGIPVGIASFFYVFFGPHPWLLIPLNAAVHAATGVTLAKIGEIAFGSWKAGRWFALPFVLWPSAILWFRKSTDGFFLFLLALLSLCTECRN